MNLKLTIPRFTSAFILLIGTAVSLSAQLPTQTPLRSTLTTRAPNGEPGQEYWQNRVDYLIRASLDTAAGSVQGALRMTYHNMSPYDLNEIWIHLEQDRFKGTEPKPTDGPRLKRHGDHYGHNIHSVAQLVNGQLQTVALARGPETLAKIELKAPIRSGESGIVDITWHFYVPPSGNRMGRDTIDRNTYAIAQWYPRAVVFDDVRGWNLDPYVGSGEFYSNFGDFDLEISVPASFIVAATGELDNPEDVLTDLQRARLTAALTSDTTIAIITQQELDNGSARPAAMMRSNGTTATWVFRALNVRDAVWAASPNFRWDASGWEGVLTQAFYRSTAASTWSHAAAMTRYSVKGYSDLLSFKYPYPQMSSVEVPEGGMEYPMLTFTHYYDSLNVLFSVLTHEIGHIWFPMIVNSNERHQAWLDEGIDMYLNTFLEGARFPQYGTQPQLADRMTRLIERALKNRIDISIAIPPDSVQRQLLGYQTYRKPAAVLHILREVVLGPDVFDKALRAYLNRWAYKHPTREDFFRTFEDISSTDLTWFWNQFVFGTPSFDQAVVEAVPATENSWRVSFENRGDGVLPLLVRLYLSDGTTRDIRHGIEVWKSNNGATTFSATYEIPADLKIVRVEVDPDAKVVDTDRSNNVLQL